MVIPNRRTRRAEALRLRTIESLRVDSRVSRLVPRPLPRSRAHPVDAGADSAAGVLLELHPARQLPRHRARAACWPGRAGACSPGSLPCSARSWSACTACGWRSPSPARARSTSRAARPSRVLPIESTLLLPAIFLVVVALFTALAQRMGREMGALPPLRGLHGQCRRQSRRRRGVRASCPGSSCRRRCGSVWPARVALPLIVRAGTRRARAAPDRDGGAGRAARAGGAP